MLSLDLIRTDPDEVKACLARRGWAGDLDGVLGLDAQWREQKGQLATLAEQRRHLAAPMAGRVPTDRPREELQTEGRRVRDLVNMAKREADEAERAVSEELLNLPNLPDQSVPDGTSRTDDRCVAEHGEQPAPSFDPLPYDDLLAGLRLADFEAGANAAAGGFVCLVGRGAALARALANFMLDLHVRELNAIELSPPVLLNRDAVNGSGHLSAAPEGMYVTQDGLFLSPGAEASILGTHRGRSFRPSELPMTYVAHTECFRRSIGSAGSGNRGLLRVHQFGRVELLRFSAPGDATNELGPLRVSTERVVQQLGLRYRVMELCAGRLSFASAKAFDLDVWAPVMQQWLTVGTCRFYGDFQARRLNITLRPRARRRGDFVHTASASAIALPRTIVALLETHQQPDGSVRLPEALWPYIGDRRELSP